MAKGVKKSGKIEYTPCRVAKGYAIGKGGPGSFAEAEMCNGRTKKKKATGKKRKKSTGGKKKKSAAKGKTATGKKVGFFKKGGRCFRRLKSGRVKFAKASSCK
jgi:hypothetical protein